MRFFKLVLRLQYLLYYIPFTCRQVYLDIECKYKVPFYLIHLFMRQTRSRLVYLYRLLFSDIFSSSVIGSENNLIFLSEKGLLAGKLKNRYEKVIMSKVRVRRGRPAHPSYSGPTVKCVHTKYKEVFQISIIHINVKCNN